VDPDRNKYQIEKSMAAFTRSRKQPIITAHWHTNIGQHQTLDHYAPTDLTAAATD
jgi:hypothetical protein